MTRLQEEMIKADEEQASNSTPSASIDLSKDVSSRRAQMSKSTVLVSEKNQPKLLDDIGLGYGSFQLLDILG